MSLIRFNSGLSDRRRNAFDALLDRFFEDAPVMDKVSFTPRVDIAETDKAFEIDVAVPGMKKEDFSIEIDENRLTVSGERKFQEEKSGKNFHSVETQYGSFSRSFFLPDAVKKENIAASYKDGVLQVVAPKDTEKQVKKTVRVS
jgi:HSP20 family protein